MCQFEYSWEFDAPVLADLFLIGNSIFANGRVFALLTYKKNILSNSLNEYATKVS